MIHLNSKIQKKEKMMQINYFYLVWSKTDQIKTFPFEMSLELIKEHKWCFKYFSNDFVLNKCNAKVLS